MLGQQCWDMLRWRVPIVWPGLNYTDLKRRLCFVRSENTSKGFKLFI